MQDRATRSGVDLGNAFLRKVFPDSTIDDVVVVGYPTSYNFV